MTGTAQSDRRGAEAMRGCHALKLTRGGLLLALRRARYSQQEGFNLLPRMQMHLAAREGLADPFVAGERG